MEDMDISDTESDAYEVEPTDDEWVESAKPRIKKRSRSRHSSMENDQFKSNSLNNGKENLGEGIAREEPELCCSCSKGSSCKTTKCKCREAGNSCGISCGCIPSKCANRASVLNEFQKAEVTEGTANGSSAEEADKERLLATQGAELLQSALVEKPPETNADRKPRKALSDIGNMPVCVSNTMNFAYLLKSSDVVCRFFTGTGSFSLLCLLSNFPGSSFGFYKFSSPLIFISYFCWLLCNIILSTSILQEKSKPKQKKKWRRSTILLVTDPLPHSQLENSDVHSKQTSSTTEADVSIELPPNLPSTRPENAASAPRAENAVYDADIPLKVPRAMRRSASSNGGVPLWDRNAGKIEDPVTKEPEAGTRSPVRQRIRTLEEKENHRR